MADERLDQVPRITVDSVRDIILSAVREGSLTELQADEALRSFTIDADPHFIALERACVRDEPPDQRDITALRNLSDEYDITENGRNDYGLSTFANTIDRICESAPKEEPAVPQVPAGGTNESSGGDGANSVIWSADCIKALTDYRNQRKSYEEIPLPEYTPKAPTAEARGSQ